MLVEAVLDLGRIDVLAAAQDQVGAPGDDVQGAIAVAAEVAGAYPAFGQHRLGRRLGVVPVADHRRRAAHLDVAFFAGRHLIAGVVGDAQVVRRQHGAHAFRRDAQHPVRRPADETAFGGAVSGGHGDRQRGEGGLDAADDFRAGRRAGDGDGLDLVRWQRTDVRAVHQPGDVGGAAAPDGDAFSAMVSATTAAGSKRPIGQTVLMPFMTEPTAMLMPDT